MKLIINIISLSLIGFFNALSADFDESKLDKKLDKIVVPNFSSASKESLRAGGVIPNFSIDIFKNVPSKIETLKIAEAPLKLRGGKNIYANKVDSVVKILTKEGGVGSGAVISKDGDIITNWHVVSGFKDVTVIFYSDSKNNPSEPKMYLANVVRTDPKVDLALIKIQKTPRNLSIFKMGKIPEIGSDVHAIGHPQEGMDWTYTKGYISQISKNYSWGYEESLHEAEIIQTQTPINPGNSGGPLINEAGRLVGINSYTSSDVIQGINFSVSVNTVNEFLSKEETEVGEFIDPGAFLGCLDVDKNGIEDTCGYDLTGNDELDVMSYDHDEDGYLDAYHIVELKNGKYVKIGEVKPIEEDGNLIMLWLIDVDNDGQAEQYGLDYDRDGRPDFLKEVS